MYGDTYGPVSYFLYVPFREIFGWSGTWDNLPAAHAAAIFFDTLTAVGLFFLGRRVRDAHLGTVLVYAWMAYPFTLYAMNSNTNDSLVAALVVLALLAIGSAPGRGVMAALAGLTKFAPFVLAPLLLRGVRERPRLRSVAAYVAAFAVTVVVCMLPVLLKHDLHLFWRDSIQYQADRASPFSIWGLWGGLGVVQHILQGAVVACGLGVYFLPARRNLVQVAALAGALLIALQMTITYWLYPYLVWFLPMVLLAVFASHPVDGGAARDSWERLQSAEGEPIAMRIGTASS
jgi:Glycosyltransferase family 87